MEYSAEQRDLITQAAEHIAALNIEIAELEEQKAALLAVFKAEENGFVARKEPYEFGRTLVKVSTNHRLDDGLARQKLPVSIYRKATKVTLDTTLARKILTPDMLDKITKKYDNKIEVKLK